jgi:hypothetical protein
MIRAREIYLRDIMGATTFHAIETGSEEFAWLWTAADYSAMIRSDWEHLITTLADRVHAGDVSLVTDWHKPPANIDKAGNTWLDHEYLAPHQYLPLLIPEKP